ATVSRKYRDLLNGYMCPGLSPFHSMGIIIQLFVPIYGALSVTVYPPTSGLQNPLPPMIATPYNVLKCGATIAPPPFLEPWARQPDAVKYLKMLKFAVRYPAYGGARPLAQKSSNLLSQAGVKLHLIYGGTKFGSGAKFISAIASQEDWEYLEFSEDHAFCVRWVPESDGLFECQLLSSDKHKFLITNLPNSDGYSTSNLWTPYPTKKDLWE
ncbi:hypothetical protein H0H92_009184, partial [Tricholoma furcatifolium]